MHKQFKKYFRRYLELHSQYPVIMAIALFILGIIFWGAFNTSMELTNTESFCISCHEMEVNVYKEYKKTIHYANRTGVRATCPDCHVPKEWIHKVVRKIRATNELFHKVIGTVDTPEKFEKNRLELATHVWDTMRDTDSRECRNCHAFDSMELKTQRERSQLAHQRAVKEKRTCIDCHMGVAHKMAKDFDKDGKLHAEFKKENRTCADCHKGMQQGSGW